MYVSGEAYEVHIDEDEIDNYQINLRTERPEDIDWDISIVQKPGQEQKVTKIVEEV